MCLHFICMRLSLLSHQMSMFLVAIVLSTGVTCVCNAKARETGPLNAKNNGLVSLRKQV